MPDQLNKQAIVNLLIDSPLREPIKINLIDIVNNTSELDLPKVFPTITKELEIFQKATERRMKLADETIAKLGGSAPTGVAPTMSSSAPTAPTPSLPPLDLPPMPAPPAAPAPVTPPPASPPPLSVPPLDLPPLPAAPPSMSEGVTASTPAVPPATPPASATTGDEAALAEIQKELDSLKSSVTTDAAPAMPAPVAAV